ncbi:MAG: hypothetical protein LUD17_06190 [Bacteroidales bacterium]|nr:hypothetical protein [Bacteroidales bacterium]
MNRILTVVMGVMLAWGLAGCDVDHDENIYCEAEIALQLPDNAQIALLRPDTDLEGTFFRNLNTQIEYTIPTFVNNRATARVQKGIYLIAFEGEAVMADGTVRSVRLADYSVTREAIYLLGDYESVTLNLSYLQ